MSTQAANRSAGSSLSSRARGGSSSRSNVGESCGPSSGSAWRSGSGSGSSDGVSVALGDLNGVTSEATHVNDPGSSVVAAWPPLMQQWSMAFATGAANRRRAQISRPRRG